MEPLETPACSMASMAAVTDPDGNQILIHERKDGTSDQGRNRRAPNRNRRCTQMHADSQEHIRV